VQPDNVVPRLTLHGEFEAASKSVGSFVMSMSSGDSRAALGTNVLAAQGEGLQAVMRGRQQGRCL